MDGPGREWFDAGGGGGLRFSCTMCGNCCTGPEGFVLFTPDESAAIARRLGVSIEVFVRDYTKDSPAGRSLREVPSRFGLDCVFLDRTTMPGKALCSIYEDRPAQCRTWPFWSSNLWSKAHWERAKRICPGMDRGALIPPERIRILRDTVDR
jgi:uncharacterized protein